MKHTNNLFELIKSLTKSEKRYFKMNAALQKGSKNYLKLFNEIDRQKNGYDEKRIKEKFSSEKFIKQITFTKNYLYRLIIRSLIAYNTESSVDARIIKYINAAKIMLNKGLIKLYFKNLNDALKISSKYERFNYSLQILELKNLYTKISSLSKGNEKISLLIQAELKKINNFHEYNAMLGRLIDLYRIRGKIRNTDVKNIISKFEKHPLLKKSSFALSYRAEENFYFIHQLLSDFKGEDENIYKHCIERLNIITRHPEPFADMNINYKHDVLTYALSYCAKTNNKRKFKYYIDILNSLPIKNKADEISLFFLKSLLNNSFYMAEKNWKKAMFSMPGIKSKLKEYSDNPEGDIHLLILYQLMVILVMAGKYNEALDESNNLLNHPRLKMRSDLEWYTRLINIIIHYELKNYKYFSYLLKSTYRYLDKKEKLFRVEKALLNFIKKLPESLNEEETKCVLLLLKEDLTKIRNEPLEKNAFKYFDFVYWIDVKLKRMHHSDSFITVK
ncbi:MAG: hypothetical protein ABI840_02195 [bacterium]